VTAAPADAFRLRAMAAADVAAVATIEAASFARPWSVDAFRHELELPFSRALVAHPAGEPATVAGYAVLWHVVDEVHLLDLAVATAYRRRGLGRTLAEAVLAAARELHARLVTLEVAAPNGAARALYEALGFAQTLVRHDYYGPGEDALVMELVTA